MNTLEPEHPTQEIELKLSLAQTADPADLARRLARSPSLARRTASRRELHNTYYDTPAQDLLGQRVALRIRRVGSAANPHWLQTLKTAGDGHSALSRRGEWEQPLDSDALSVQALQGTPWVEFDPHGDLFRALAPRFVTRFERTTWMVRRRDGSAVEVSLDLGSICVDGKRAPICELELELLRGRSSALFELARELAARVAVLPLLASKAERGYALAQDRLDQPLRFDAPVLTRSRPLVVAAGAVLRASFAQFVANLELLRRCDAPELVHQARVGWRRFAGALRLFRRELVRCPVPDLQVLRPLLRAMGDLRDLDVASTETLPRLAEAFAGAGDARARAWRAATDALTEAAAEQRKSLRSLLEQPGPGLCLLGLTQWLEDLATGAGDVDVDGVSSRDRGEKPRPWARRRLKRLSRQLRAARKNSSDPDSEHRARIIAKRLRYGVEALGQLLPKGRASRWHRQAVRLQTAIGAARDVRQAALLAEKLRADRAVVAFLFGMATGLDGADG